VLSLDVRGHEAGTTAEVRVSGALPDAAVDDLASLVRQGAQGVGHKQVQSVPPPPGHSMVRRETSFKFESGEFARRDLCSAG
jgi:hypothetical protein